MLNLNHFPLLPLLLPFIGGIIGVIYLKPETMYLLFGFGLTAIVFILALLIKGLNTNYKYRWLFGILVYSNLVLAGACLTSLKYQNIESTSSLLTEANNQILIAEIIEPTQVKERSIKAITRRKGTIRNIYMFKGKLK
jgi:competence protein ComEC